MIGAAERRELLEERAGGYARVALDNVQREFPHDLRYLVTGPEDRPGRPRELHPAFYGSLDWHSCVEMHWVLVRLLRLAPDRVPGAEARAVLDRHLSESALAVEAAFVADPDNRMFERPYGWGWALTLTEEAAGWDDPDGRRWEANLSGLATVLADRFVEWLPRATYSSRYGVHPNSAFGLSRALPWARRRAAAGDGRLLGAITEAAQRWYADDADYPGGWEPSGADFLSPALVEAELMAQLLEPAEFPGWLDRFLPGIAAGEPAALFRPAVVSDDTDGQIAHLHGLNLCRAWAWRRLAAALPDNDGRREPMVAAARRHAESALDQATGSDYMVEHWLAAYALLYLSD